MISVLFFSYLTSAFFLGNRGFYNFQRRVFTLSWTISPLPTMPVILNVKITYRDPNLSLLHLP
jgi:hypothetical protein